MIRSRFSRRCAPLLALVLLLAAGACARPTLLDRRIDGGGSVASLVAAADTGVVLLYEPSDCFVCYGSLQPWLLWGRTHPGSLALVFTRPPTADERVQLATYRIRADGVLRPTLRDRLARPEAPLEMLVVDGRVVARAPIQQGRLSTPLYRQLIQGGAAAPPRALPAP